MTDPIDTSEAAFDETTSGVGVPTAERTLTDAALHRAYISFGRDGVGV